MKLRILKITFYSCIGFLITINGVLASESDISFQIELHGQAAAFDSMSYKVGGIISIKCTWRNNGNTKYSFLLKDHDPYHGTDYYPSGLLAKVLDGQKNILTKNSTTNGNWWSWYYLRSRLATEMPGDIVTLGPGQEVIRIVPLEKVLLGLVNIGDGLEEGSYRVQFKLGNLLSNELNLELTSE